MGVSVLQIFCASLAQGKLMSGRELRASHPSAPLMLFNEYLDLVSWLAISFRKLVADLKQLLSFYLLMSPKFWQDGILNLLAARSSDAWTSRRASTSGPTNGQLPELPTISSPASTRSNLFTKAWSVELYTPIRWHSGLCQSATYNSASACIVLPLLRFLPRSRSSVSRYNY